MLRRKDSSSAPQIINSNAARDSSVNASILTDTKEVFLLPYIQKTKQRNYGSHKESHGNIQRNYTTPKRKLYRYCKSDKALSYLYKNCYDHTPLVPRIPLTSNYDPPAAQHNDHNQTYHSRKIIESHGEKTKNTYTSVINELITIRIIEQGDRRRHNTSITNLLICLNTYIYS